MALLPVVKNQFNTVVLSSSDNLDNIKEYGIYSWGVSSIPQNVPYSASATMIVSSWGSSSIIQIIHYDNYIYKRIYTSNDWLSWRVFWDVNKIQTAIRGEFAIRKLEIASSSSIGSGKTFSVFRSGNGFNFASAITIPAGSYTCTIQIGSTTTTKYLSFGTVSHSNVRTWMLNRYNATTTIDDVPINNNISLGTGVVIWDNSTKATTTTAYLVRTSSSQWALCSNVAGTTNTSWKWEPSTSFSFRPFSSISNNTIVANSYDTDIWV